MNLAEVLKKPEYILLAFVSASITLVVYVYTQLLGIVQNLDVWLATIPWYNAFLLLVFIVLFVVAFSYQVFLWRQPKICSIKTKVKGTGTSSISMLGMFLVAQCPACASLGILFLPASAMFFLAQYSWLVNLISIALLLFTLNYLGAFKKTGARK